MWGGALARTPRLRPTPSPRPHTHPSPPAGSCLEGCGAAGAAGRATPLPWRSDLVMLLAQLVFAINHMRRWLDSSLCGGSGSSLLSAAAWPLVELSSYPCGARLAERLLFLARRPVAACSASAVMPVGDLWALASITILLAQLLSVLVLPARVYCATARRPCQILVGLAPKAVSLACLLAWPEAEPSSYFEIYLPVEGAILVWQQVVYNVSESTGRRGDRNHNSLPRGRGKRTAPPLVACCPTALHGKPVVRAPNLMRFA